MEHVPLQLLDHVPLEVQGGERGQAGEAAAPEVADAAPEIVSSLYPDTESLPVLSEVEEGEASQRGQGAGNLLEVTTLEIEVLEGLLQS